MSKIDYIPQYDLVFRTGVSTDIHQDMFEPPFDVSVSLNTATVLIRKHRFFYFVYRLKAVLFDKDEYILSVEYKDGTSINSKTDVTLLRGITHLGIFKDPDILSIDTQTFRGKIERDTIGFTKINKQINKQNKYVRPVVPKPLEPETQVGKRKRGRPRKTV